MFHYLSKKQKKKGMTINKSIQIQISYTYGNFSTSKCNNLVNIFQ